jgi:hypothetical protein
MKSTRDERKNQQLAAQQQEEKLAQTSQPNRSAFVPKIYSDEI